MVRFVSASLEHGLEFMMCNCEPLAVTMTRAGCVLLSLLIFFLLLHLHSLVGQRRCSWKLTCHFKHFKVSMSISHYEGIMNYVTKIH